MSDSARACVYMYICGRRRGAAASNGGSAGAGCGGGVLTDGLCPTYRVLGAVGAALRRW